MQVCPASSPTDCLSAITQKKGDLNETEKKTMLTHGSVWGCDVCQLICPHTQAAIQRETIFSPIPYFSEYAIPHLTRELLDGMSEADFSERAYAWRGRDTIRRNLMLFEASSSEGD